MFPFRLIIVNRCAELFNSPVFQQLIKKRDYIINCNLFLTFALEMDSGFPCQFYQSAFGNCITFGICCTARDFLCIDKWLYSVKINHTNVFPLGI